MHVILSNVTFLRFDRADDVEVSTLVKSAGFFIHEGNWSAEHRQ